MLLRRTWIVIGWLGVVAVIYLSLMQEPPQFDVEQGDKIEHIAAYGCLMLWFAQLAVGRDFRIPLAVALVGLGIGLEFAQLQTGYRTFSYGDMVADAIGVAFGWLLALPRSPNSILLIECAVDER